MIPAAARQRRAQKLLYLGELLHLSRSRRRSRCRPRALWTGDRSSRRARPTRRRSSPAIEAVRGVPPAARRAVHRGDRRRRLRSGRRFQPGEFARRRRADAAHPRGRAHGGAVAVDVWGSGTPRREFIYVDDLADACVFAMEHYDGRRRRSTWAPDRSTSIAELAQDVVARSSASRASSASTRSKPDGMPFKGLDSSVLHGLGWRPKWTLARGLEETYRWYLRISGSQDLRI